MSAYRWQFDDDSIIVTGKHCHRVLYLLIERYGRDLTTGGRALVVEARIRGTGLPAGWSTILRKQTDAQNSVGSQGRNRVLRWGPHILAASRNRKGCVAEHLNRNRARFLASHLNVRSLNRTPREAGDKGKTFNQRMTTRSILLRKRNGEDRGYKPQS